MVGGEALFLIDHTTEAARRWQNYGDNPKELWLTSRAAEVLSALRRFGKEASPVLDRFLRPQRILLKQLEQDSLPHDRRALIGGPATVIGRRIGSARLIRIVAAAAIGHAPAYNPTATPFVHQACDVLKIVPQPSFDLLNHLIVDNLIQTKAMQVLELNR
jgi:hypothetical protein